jgi:hypothetical protein
MDYCCAMDSYDGYPCEVVESLRGIRSDFGNSSPGNFKIFFL